ncbi:hypothetical protein DSO57_1034549 [Entomophthora muscae]|uniref:Uncharacterized protein n=1 Tax=Entomophthora muscae TaxID=34485 RepID=A0ACC2TAF8_9FUNG|nr:hypothetical protein DSO57_1034549 [Entomophthora muscae]
MTATEQKEYRMFILKREATTTGKSNELNIVELSQTRKNEKNKYLILNGTICELNVIQTPHQAWFAGNKILAGGKLYLGTPIDPLFLALPFLDGNWFDVGDSEKRMFKQLNELLPQKLMEIPNLHNLIQTICDTKALEVDPEETTYYFRLNDDKLMKWLCKKYSILSDHLKLTDPHFQINSFDIISDYLPPHKTLKLQKALGILTDDLKKIEKSTQIITAETSVNSPDMFMREKVEASKKPKANTPVRAPKGVRLISSFFTKVESKSDKPAN